jgi:hypothetical protein
LDRNPSEAISAGAVPNAPVTAPANVLPGAPASAPVAPPAAAATPAAARDFAVAEVLADAIRPHAREAHERGVELLLDVGADVPATLFGDADELKAAVAKATRAAVDGAKGDEIVVTAASAGANGDEITLEVDVRAAGVEKGEPIARRMRAVASPAGGAALKNARLLVIAEREKLRSILRDEVVRAGGRAEVTSDFDEAFARLTGAAGAGDRFALVVIALDGAGESRHDRARKMVQKMRFSKVIAKTPLVVLSPGSKRDPATIGFPLTGIARLTRPVTGPALVRAIEELLAGS